MAERRVEEYAFKHGLSHGAAKRRMKSHKSIKSAMPIRGIAVAGTGKPKGAQKG